jgi:hypothetical protein
VVIARPLRQYFQSRQIIIKTDYPIKHVLKKPDLVGRMVAWSIELSEFDITFVPIGCIKAHVLVDFVVELSSRVWILSVDGASNLRSRGADVILEGPDGVLIEMCLT